MEETGKPLGERATWSTFGVARWKWKLRKHFFCEGAEPRSSSRIAITVLTKVSALIGGNTVKRYNEGE
jgi:hypothetical protein